MELVFELERQKVEFGGCSPFISMANCVFLSEKMYFLYHFLLKNEHRLVYFLLDIRNQHTLNHHISNFERNLNVKSITVPTP